MSWTPIAPFKVIAGTGRSVAVASSANTTDTVAMGAQTRACVLSLTPAATAYAAMVTIQPSGVAATATKDICLKSTDPPLVVGCSPGDKIAVWGLAATGTLFVTELTH